MSLQGWKSIPKKVKKQLIFDSSPKSKEIIDFDGSLEKERIKNIVIDIRYYTEHLAVYAKHFL